MHKKAGPPGAYINDGWFETNTTPMDGDSESGAYPHQSKALKDYLNNLSSPSEAAAAILTSEGFEDAYDVQCRMIGLMEDALVELPELNTPPLILLLKEIKKRKEKETGKPFMAFGYLWSDMLKGDWRSTWAAYDPATRVKEQKAHIHLAYVEASCAMADIGPHSEDGLLPLSWGYECICAALECPDATWDFEVPAAAVWLSIAGVRLKEGARKRERSWALNTKGRMREPGPMSLDRWEFWVKRFREIEEAGEAILGEVGEVISGAARGAIHDAQALD